MDEIFQEQRTAVRANSGVECRMLSLSGVELV